MNTIEPKAVRYHKVDECIYAYEGKNGTTYKVKVGKIKTRNFPSKSEAKIHRNILLTERDQRKNGAAPSDVDGKLTVSQINDKWLEYYGGKVTRGNRKETSLAAHARRLELFKAEIGDIKGNQLERADMQHAIDNLKVADSTKTYAFTSQRAAFKWAVDEGLIDNIKCCTGIELPQDATVAIMKRPRLDNRPFDPGKHVLCPDEVQEILSNLEGHDTWMMVYTLWCTGLRRGELYGLQWGDIDFQRKVLYVERQVMSTGQVDEKLKTKRSKAPVHIGEDVSPKLLELLDQHREQQKATMKELTGERYSPEWFVFSTPEAQLRQRGNEPPSPSRPVPAKNLAGTLRCLLSKTEYAQVTPHCFRHAHGSYLIATGYSTVEVAARLRDTIPTIEKTYAHDIQLRSERSKSKTIVTNVTAPLKIAVIPYV